MRAVIVLSHMASYFLAVCFAPVSQAARGLASIGLFRPMKQDCCAPPIMIDAWQSPVSLQGRCELKPNRRIGPATPRLAAAGFRAARWLARETWALRAFISSARNLPSADRARPRQARRGETVYLAGLGLPGTHNSGVALVEVTQAHGPRLIVNNEEERFSGNKHTTEYPTRLDRRDGRDAARHGARHRRYRRLAHQLGLSDAGGHHGPLGAGGSCRKA